jgi:hypothetical protein
MCFLAFHCRHTKLIINLMQYAASVTISSLQYNKRNRKNTDSICASLITSQEATFKKNFSNCEQSLHPHGLLSLLLLLIIIIITPEGSIHKYKNNTYTNKKEKVW